MRSTSRFFVGALLVSAALAGPAQAEKSDRVFLDQMRSAIADARAESGTNHAGAAELAMAEARLPDLSKALDNNEEGDARSATNAITTLIEAARMRTRAAAPVVAQPAAYRPVTVTVSERPIRRIAARKPRPRSGCIIASR